jgi:hypothetical protein
MKKLGWRGGRNYILHTTALPHIILVQTHGELGRLPILVCIPQLGRLPIFVSIPPFLIVHNVSQFDIWGGPTRRSVGFPGRRLMTVEVAFFLIQALSAACCFQIKSPDLSVNIRTLEKTKYPEKRCHGTARGIHRADALSRSPSNLPS